MGADVVRHKIVRDTVVDENGLVISTTVRDVELHESQERHRDRNVFYPITPPERPSLPPLLPPEPAPETPTEETPKPIKRKNKRHKNPHTTKKRAGSLMKTRHEIASDHREMRRCPRCNELVLRGKMLEHKIQRHHDQPGLLRILKTPKIHPKPDAQSKPQSFNDPKSFVACPVCGVSVRNDHLAKHIRKAHQQAQAKRKGAQGKAGKSLAKDGTDVTFEHSRIEREEDGSKNIGYLARERGRFGSHPMHDDYADEGGAD